jgi:anti-anti-sigma factor
VLPVNQPSGYRLLHPDSPAAWVRFDEPAEWILVVRVLGELDVVTVPPLRAALHARLRGNRPCRLVLDLSGVTLLASAALTMLLELHHDARAGERHVVLAGTGHRAVHRPLRVTGLLTLFDTRPSVEHALRGSTASRRPTHAPAAPGAGSPSLRQGEPHR